MRKLFNILFIIGLMCLDYLISFLMMAFWTVSVLFCKIITTSLNNCPSDNKPTKIIFFSNEGFNVAPTRVRCYSFCEYIKSMGINASVYAYWDVFPNNSDSPFPYRLTLEAEKILKNIVTFIIFLGKGKTLIYDQRPHFAFTVPLFLKIVNKSEVIMDIDDWIFNDRVVSIIRIKNLIPLYSMYCNTCIVSSTHLKSKLSTNFKHVYTIPTYVNSSKFNPHYNNSDNITFSWIGTIFQDFTYDNVIFLINSFIAANKNIGENNNSCLEIVGGGQFYDKVKNYVNKNSRGCRISIKGWLPPNEMPDYLQSIDVGLYALLAPSDFQKSKSPTNIFEYMACGKPVISTPLGEAKYFVEHGVTGFLASDIESFSDYMVRLYKDSQLRNDMGHAARQRVEEKYNLSKGCTELRTIIARYLQSQPQDSRGSIKC